jgi:ribosome-associated protein
VTESKPSKSARKRHFTGLQELGELLIGLTDEQLVAIVTEPRLIDAVREARSISAQGALRRQKQLIGKIMRNIEPEPIRRAIEALGQQSREENRLFREAESWRDRLCADTETALADFQAQTGCDPLVLRQRLKDYAAAARDPARKTAHRQIFREIHKLLASKVQSNAG